jgi:hypothetical protein
MFAFFPYAWNTLRTIRIQNNLKEQVLMLGTDTFRKPRNYFMLQSDRFLVPQYLSCACQCRAEQSSSLLLATSQHGHSWYWAPLGPMTIFLFTF